MVVISLEFKNYQNMSLGVDCVIMTTDTHKEDNKRMNPARSIQVLLIKRTIDPFNNCWSIPGGLVEPDKGLEETINDKLFTKTNIGDIYKEQLYTYGDNIERDPRGRVVSVAYLALVDKNKLNNIQSTFYGEVKWFWVDLTESGLSIIDPDTGEDVKNLAFDHAKILTDAVLRLRNKVMYTDVAFNLLPENFTMRELQDVYENILNKSLFSFRRTIGNKVVETDQFSDDKAHRPARLYKFNKAK